MQQRYPPSKLAAPSSWETDITLLSNPLIVKQVLLMVVVSGVGMAIFLSFILAASGEFNSIMPILNIFALITLVFGVAAFLIMLIFFRNKTRARFTLNEHGILWETLDKTAKASANTALAAGLVTASSAVAGAALLAKSREKEFITWEELVTLKANPKKQMLILRNSWRSVMMVITLPENFEQVKQYAQQQIAAKTKQVEPPIALAESIEASDNTPAKRRLHPIIRALLRTSLVFLAISPLMMLSDSVFFELDLFLPILLLVFSLATVWLVPLFGWVMLGVAGMIAVQLIWMVSSGAVTVYEEEMVLLVLAYMGLAYLFWFAWAAVNGRVVPTLFDG